jgi:uncharacterized protein
LVRNGLAALELFYRFGNCTTLKKWGGTTSTFLETVSVMELSRYIKIYPYEEKPHYFMLFSTKKASTVLLHETTLRAIDNGLLSSSDEETLSPLGFLVPDIDEERKEMLGILDDANNKITRLNVVAVMNLDCNLACRYCFEGKIKGNLYMSSETAQLLINFIEGYLEKGKNVNIVFYGGEPLLSTEIVKHISNRVKVLAEQKGLEYTFSLVTNGTLLTRKRVEELALLGLKGAKITIDGPRKNHDRYRPFKSESGSFETIIKNIKDTCKLIKIQIGGNFNKKNHKDFPRLLDYLLEEGLTPDNISAVKFDPIVKITGEFALPDFRDGCESINEPWVNEASMYLREEILKRSFYTPKIKPSPCMMEIQGNIVVNYDGTFYKCPGLIGRGGFEAGDLKTGIKDYGKSHNLDSWKTEECLNCEYIPLCFGGCRFMKLLKDGNMKGVDCKKPYFDATLETFIKQEIKYKVTANVH